MPVAPIPHEFFTVVEYRVPASTNAAHIYSEKDCDFDEWVLNGPAIVSLLKAVCSLQPRPAYIHQIATSHTLVSFDESEEDRDLRKFIGRLIFAVGRHESISLSSRKQLYRLPIAHFLKCIQQPSFSWHVKYSSEQEFRNTLESMEVFCKADHVRASAQPQNASKVLRELAVFPSEARTLARTTSQGRTRTVGKGRQLAEDTTMRDADTCTRRSRSHAQKSKTVMSWSSTTSRPEDEGCQTQTMHETQMTAASSLGGGPRIEEWRERIESQDTADEDTVPQDSYVGAADEPPWIAWQTVANPPAAVQNPDLQDIWSWLPAQGLENQFGSWQQMEAPGVEMASLPTSSSRLAHRSENCRPQQQQLTAPQHVDAVRAMPNQEQQQARAVEERRSRTPILHEQQQHLPPDKVLALSDLEVIAALERLGQDDVAAVSVTSANARVSTEIAAQSAAPSTGAAETELQTPPRQKQPQQPAASQPAPALPPRRAPRKSGRSLPAFPTSDFELDEQRGQNDLSAAQAILTRVKLLAIDPDPRAAQRGRRYGTIGEKRAIRAMTVNYTVNVRNAGDVNVALTTAELLRRAFDRYDGKKRFASRDISLSSRPRIIESADRVFLLLAIRLLRHSFMYGHDGPRVKGLHYAVDFDRQVPSSSLASAPPGCPTTVGHLMRRANRLCRIIVACGHPCVVLVLVRIAIRSSVSLTTLLDTLPIEAFCNWLATGWVSSTRLHISRPAQVSASGYASGLQLEADLQWAHANVMLPLLKVAAERVPATFVAFDGLVTCNVDTCLAANIRHADQQRYKDFCQNPFPDEHWTRGRFVIDGGASTSRDRSTLDGGDLESDISSDAYEEGNGARIPPQFTIEIDKRTFVGADIPLLAQVPELFDPAPAFLISGRLNLAED